MRIEYRTPKGQHGVASIPIDMVISVVARMIKKEYDIISVAGMR